MDRKELIILISLVVVLGVLNMVNYIRKENLNRNLTMIVEEGIRPVSINMAMSSELEDIPGIGPSLANRIIDYREKNGEFKDLNDLKKVKGIGENLFRKMLPYVKL